ncbi:MAG: hypothetical protein NZ519_08675 [Bacteroidia bacterium]|nr:hypothetical protein [Bacteroidia bacterium]
MRSVAKHRSESVVRNAPTLASARGTPKKTYSLAHFSAARRFRSCFSILRF